MVEVPGPSSSGGTSQSRSELSQVPTVMLDAGGLTPGDKEPHGGHISPCCMDSGAEVVGEGGQDEPDTYKTLHQDTGHQAPKVYARRWYILLLLGAHVGVSGGLVWNTWGPISDSAGRVFGWTNSDIALLSNWGLISFFIATPLYAWLVDVKGLRIATITSSSMCALGSGLRVITSSNPAAYWLINAGQVINGLSLPMIIVAPTVLSICWFPVQQRTTATAAIAALNMFGLGISFIFGPLLVPDHSNSTAVSPNQSFTHDMVFAVSNEDVAKTRDDIMRLLYIEFGIAAVLFLMVLIYYPAKPPTPPSTSAGVERVPMKQAVKQLIRNVTFWELTFAYGLSEGVYVSWLAVLHVNVKDLGVSESEAGLAGSLSVLCGCVACLIIARFADMFKKKMKVFLIILFSLAVIMFGVFSLATQRLIPFSIGLFYTCSIVGGVSLYGVLPLFYELICEATYPIAEGITNSSLAISCNAVGLSFLSILMIPNIGTSWMNWFLTASVAVCIPVLFLVKEQYNRLDLDTQNQDPNNTKATPETTRF